MFEVVVHVEKSLHWQILILSLVQFTLYILLISLKLELCFLTVKF